MYRVCWAEEDPHLNPLIVNHQYNGFLKLFYALKSHIIKAQSAILIVLASIWSN